MVCYLKDGQTRYFAGVFVGWAVVEGVRKGVPPTGVISSYGAGTLIHGKGYLLFKGAHSKLLYTANKDWLIIEG